MASLSMREINQAAARAGIGRQYILKEMRVFDIWGMICRLCFPRKSPITPE